VYITKVIVECHPFAVQILLLICGIIMGLKETVHDFCWNL